MTDRLQRVLVVGGLGFIGQHLSERLRGEGAHVTVATRSIASYRDAAAVLVSRGISVVEADLRDESRIRQAVKDQDAVFDLAGRSGATLSMEDPWTDLDVNCRGTLVLLEALRVENRHAKLVFASSRLTYGHGGSAPVSEDRSLDPLCLHAVHKIAAEQYVRLYSRVYGIRAAIARMTNPYGPGQPSGRTAYGVVNQLIHLALNDAALTIYGDGGQCRDYIYIDDAVEALARLGRDPASDGRTYNVGSGVGTPLVEMARRITSMAEGGRIEFAPWPEMAERVETGDFIADITRIRGELGWVPRTSLADGLRRTVEHYKRHVRT